MKLAIVAPAYNEESSLPNWIQQVDNYFSTQKSFANVDLIIVDDGSADETYESCLKTAPQLKCITLHAIKLIRNSGHQAALTCGLIEAAELQSSPDMVVTMDCDGEHPIAILPKLVEEWKKGHALVHTIRSESKNLPFHKRLMSKIFYVLIQKLTRLPIEPGMADFKLWDTRFLRSMIPYLRRAGSLRLFAVYIYPKGPKVSFDQLVIQGRVSRFSAKKMISLAVQSIVFYSAFPMRIIGFIGFISIGLSLLLTAYTLWAYIQGRSVPGWASVMVTISFFSGCNSLCLYIVAEYLLRFSFRSQLPQFIKSPKE